jgi:DNA-binding beta-propeller fold protein YncE
MRMERAPTCLDRRPIVAGSSASTRRGIGRRAVLTAGAALSLRALAGVAPGLPPGWSSLRRVAPTDPRAGPREPALAVRLDQPQGVAFGPGGILYVADVNHHRVRRLDPDGRVTTVAGSGIQGYGGDGDAAIYADLRRCSGLALDRVGGLYIADSGNHCVRYVAPDGRIATVAGDGQAGYAGDGGPAASARLNYPTGVALGPDGTA